MDTTAPILLLAGALAAVHLLAGNLRFLQGLPRSRYLSLSGGVSVAYVFIHLLPEITVRQLEIARGAEIGVRRTPIRDEQLLFLVALIGFATFYGLEQVAVRSRRGTDRRAVAGGAETRPSARVFWLHIGSFAVYNVLIGYFLLHREERGAVNLLLYVIAMALHFVVNDHGLREHHQDAYTRLGRWILAVAVLLGGVIGVLTTVNETLLGLLLAFLAGGVILNVVKEELPEERESSFWAFAIGLASYTVILVLL